MPASCPEGAGQVSLTSYGSVLYQRSQGGVCVCRANRGCLSVCLSVQGTSCPSWTMWPITGWAPSPGPPCRRTVRSSCRSPSSQHTPPSSWPQTLVSVGTASWAALAHPGCSHPAGLLLLHPSTAGACGWQLWLTGFPLPPRTRLLFISQPIAS